MSNIMTAEQYRATAKKIIDEQTTMINQRFENIDPISAHLNELLRDGWINEEAEWLDQDSFD